jgi:hypothetical protein
MLLRHILSLLLDNLKDGPVDNNIKNSNLKVPSIGASPFVIE